MAEYFTEDDFWSNGPHADDPKKWEMLRDLFNRFVDSHENLIDENYRHRFLQERGDVEHDFLLAMLDRVAVGALRPGNEKGKVFSYATLSVKRAILSYPGDIQRRFVSLDSVSPDRYLKALVVPARENHPTDESILNAICWDVQEVLHGFALRLFNSTMDSFLRSDLMPPGKNKLNQAAVRAMKRRTSRFQVFKSRAEIKRAILGSRSLSELREAKRTLPR